MEQEAAANIQYAVESMDAAGATRIYQWGSIVGLTSWATVKSSRVSVVVVDDSTAAAVAAPSGRWCSQFTEELQFDIFLKRILLSSAVKIC